MKKLGLFIPTSSRDYNIVQAGIWIRVFQMLPCWKSHNIKVNLNHYFKRYDWAIVYRSVEISTVLKILWLKLFSKKVFYDQNINFFEDAPHILKKRKLFIKFILKIIDGVICSTVPIKESASKRINTVFHIKDGLDFNHFKCIKTVINFDTPMFIWSGVAEKSLYLNAFDQSISKRITLITNKMVENVKLNFDYEFIEWTHETFPKSILNGDIAILPRDISTVYNQGHSEFKALVFAVSGIPIIANKVPSYLYLAEYYDGIVFLEDYNNDVNKCIDVLKTKSLNTKLVRKVYDVRELCIKQMDYLNG